jgi:hypothetical protein
MSLRERLRGLWLRLFGDAEPEHGLFLFDEVAEALRAEKVLRAAGYELRLVAPPPALRAGCDLALALAPFERPGAERALRAAGVTSRGWADGPEGTRALAHLVTSVDFGDFLMVRAGNMKITFEKGSGRIVNTSGGGCPDIPYLNMALVGRTLHDAPRPRELGFTLCGLMLDRAFEEARARLAGGAR